MGGDGESRVRRWGRVVLGSVFPPRCVACRAYLPLDDAVARELADASRPGTSAALWFCPPCRDRLFPIDHACPRCAQPSVDFLDQPAASALCGRCVADPPPWERAVCALEHAGAARDAILRLKARGGRGVGLGLGAMLAARLAGRDLSLAGAVVLPIPLHRERLAERGFNQAEVVATAVARRLGLELGRGVLAREAAGTTQRTLGREARFLNLAGAYRVAHPEQVEGRGVLLVDDVMTTGATFKAVAQAVVRAGGRVVAVAAVSRKG